MTTDFDTLGSTELAAVTGGYHDPVPSSSDTGTAGLSPAPCYPSYPNPNPKPSPVWVLI